MWVPRRRAPRRALVRSSVAGGIADDRVTITNFQAIIGPQVLSGDYNDDGVVDAVDYTVWRNNDGSSLTLPNESPDATTPGLVDQEDYDAWAANYGATAPTPAIVRPFSSLLLPISSPAWRIEKNVIEPEVSKKSSPP